MSMLAEPRKKQRWTLNPRGKQWSDDQNKFGQKMLEKMGWTAGKGLGANEQGMTDHVRVKYKDDQAGIGYSKDTQDKLWTEHQESFNDLLLKLHNNKGLDLTEKPVDTNDLSGKSLELKSQQSRARVHYHKFTRGKDVNKYSAKDLANIFGKKDLTSKSKEDLNEKSSEEKEEENPEPVGTADKTAGILTIKGGMITEYFKNKMPLMSSKAKQSRENSRTQDCAEDGEEIKDEVTERKEEKSERDSESESERYVGFGYSNSIESTGKSPGKSKSLLNPSLSVFTNSPWDFKSPKSTPKKRKSEFYCSTPAMEEKKQNNIQEECEATPKKRKTEYFAFENPALDILSANSSAPSTSSPFINKMEVFRCETTPIECIPHEGHEKRVEDLESTKKKKKKKRKDAFVEGFVNDGLNINDKNGNNSNISEVSELDNMSIDPPTSFLRNKMEVLRSEVMPVECIPNEEYDNKEDEPESAKKKKKKKKKDIFIDGFVNDALNVDDRYEESLKRASGNVPESFEVSRSDVFGLANDALDLTDETNGKKRVTFNDVVEYNTNSAKKKKKSNGKLDKFEVDIEKSKKKKKFLPSKGILVTEVNSFVNKALDVEIVDEEIIDNEENERKMNKERKRREKGKRMSNLETIKEVLEEEEEVENDDKSRNEAFNDSLVKNTSDELGEMSLETPIKKKKKKRCKDKEKIDENVDDLTENQLESDEYLKKKKENKIKEMCNSDDVNPEFNEQLKKKKKKSKKNKVKDEVDMEIDEDLKSVREENSNKENENSHDAKDFMKVDRKNKRIKKNKDRQIEELEEDVENEEKEKCYKKKVKVCEIDEEVAVVEVKGMNNETNNRDKSENIAKSQWESKSKRPKKIFRALFAKGPAVHFPGSSINEIKGYGIS